MALMAADLGGRREGGGREGGGRWKVEGMEGYQLRE